MKKIILLIIVTFIMIIVLAQKAKLPKPEIIHGLRGKQFGVDKHINEQTIDNYLNRSDTEYRDMRMLIDPGNYKAIGGDSYLSGYIKGFEVVPLPYIVNVNDLPKKVGKTYQGNTLYTEKNGNYKANYEESSLILKSLFPQNKNIFLMCGAAGYAGKMKKMLIKLGWDKNKIYNVGGYWYYNGNNKVKVKTKIKGKTYYNFASVPYHNIDFSKLHKAS